MSVVVLIRIPGTRYSKTTRKTYAADPRTGGGVGLRPRFFLDIFSRQQQKRKLADYSHLGPFAQPHGNLGGQRPNRNHIARSRFSVQLHGLLGDLAAGFAI